MAHGNQGCFVVKVHVGVHRDSGLIHLMGSTAANFHDLTVASELLT